MHRRDGTRALSPYLSETIRQHVLINVPVALSCRSIKTTRLAQFILYTTTHQNQL